MSKAYEFNQSKCITVQKARIKDLEKENEQLKQQVSEQGTQIDFLKDENKHMRDLVNENEQLKQELQEFKEWEMLKEKKLIEYSK